MRERARHFGAEYAIRNRNPSWRAISVHVRWFRFLSISYSHSQNTLDLVSRKNKTKSIWARQSLLWCKQGIRSRKISRSNEFSHYSAPPMAFGVVLARWRSVRGSGFLDTTQSRSTGSKHICWKAESVCGEEDIFIAEGRQIQTEHRNLLGICCNTRIMLMISIVCAVGRRMSAKTTTAKSKKIKNKNKNSMRCSSSCCMNACWAIFSFVTVSFWRERKKNYTHSRAIRF